MTVLPETRLSDEGALARLAEAGFVKIGEWRLTSCGEGIELAAAPAQLAGVYVYLVDGAPHYVGSAQSGLRTRLARYITSMTGRTSMRVRQEIIRCLVAGRRVEVLALFPPRLEWKGLPVDLVAGIEEGLIGQMRPAWNVRGNRKARKRRTAVAS